MLFCRNPKNQETLEFLSVYRYCTNRKIRGKAEHQIRFMITNSLMVCQRFVFNFLFSFFFSFFNYFLIDREIDLDFAARILIFVLFEQCRSEHVNSTHQSHSSKPGQSKIIKLKRKMRRDRKVLQKHPRYRNWSFPRTMAARHDVS